MRVKMQVYGRVQGVGFRYMTKILADDIGVYGIVRNEYDGSVYIEANGDADKVTLFIQKVKESPSPAGVVKDLLIEYDADIAERTTFRAI